MNRTLLLFSTLFLCWFAWTFLYPYHFGLPYFETDFVDYCVGVAQWDDPTAHFPPKRSRLAGWLPSILTRGFSSIEYGILKGLLLASSISMVGIAVLLTTWMERVQILAGWCTLACLMACSPWIGMGRFLTFYPEIILGITVATVGIWYGLFTGSTDVPNISTTFGRGLIVGGSIAICGLIDARGLIWAGWFTILSIGWKLWHRDSLRDGLAFWTGWLCSLLGGWTLGKYTYGPYSTSLIRQLDIAPLRIALGLDDASSIFPVEFHWGWEWRGLLDNILFVLSQQTEGLPSSTPSLYWWTWLGFIAVSLLFLVRKHTLVVLVLIPTFVAYLQIGHAVENHVRFYMQSLPILVTALGLLISEHIPERKVYQVGLPMLLLILLPYVSLFANQHWTIEREISHKMLSQAHPNHRALTHRSIVYGTPIHIQTLPVTSIERQITQNWDMVCTESLQQHSPTLWFEHP